jgi:hypothetical protein
MLIDVSTFISSFFFHAGSKRTNTNTKEAVSNSEYGFQCSGLD